MHKFIRKKTLFSRLFLCALYVLFFAVQLNLRYNSIEINQSGVASYTAGKTEAGAAKVLVEDGRDAKFSLTTRLNKRYFPGYCCPVQLPVLPSGNYLFVDVSMGNYENPLFFQQHHQLTQRRGPPADC